MTEPPVAGPRDGGPTILTLLAAVASAAILSSGALTPPAALAEPATGSAEQSTLSQDKLDSLLAPIALYPDQLLTQVLMASTYPLDVVAAARFVKEHPGLKGEALDRAVMEKNWDPSVQSLTAFPQVLEMMNDKLEWAQELGDAFLADEKQVMQTVQRLRQKADAAGNLKSGPQQKVIKEKSTIVIEPAQPEVVYVPSYNPTVVYGSWWAPSYPPPYYPPPPGAMLTAGLIGFGIGMAASDNHWGWSHADWNGGNVNVDIDRNNAFVNRNAEFKNKVQNGNWKHDPSQRKGVAYRDARTRGQYSKVDPGAVSARREARGYQPGGQRGGAAQERAFGGREAQRPGGGGFQRASDTRPSFNASQSRQQTQRFSDRGASSRASMGSRWGGAGGGRGGGGGRGRR